MRALIILLASGFYLGYIPIASGTWGTLAGIPLFWLFAGITRTSPALSVAALVALVAFSCWIAEKAEREFGQTDSGKIVIDEIAGYVVATMFLEPSLRTAIIAFFAFRLFDVVKVFPARYIDQNVHGGYGVVLDDVVAGIYANVLTRAILVFL